MTDRLQSHIQNQSEGEVPGKGIARKQKQAEKRSAGELVVRSVGQGLLGFWTRILFTETAQARETGRSKAAPRETGAACGGVWGEKGRRCQRHGGCDGLCLLLG